MALDVRKFSMEELNIEKLVNDEHTPSTDEFDDLFDTIKRDAEAKKLTQPEEPEEPPEEPPEPSGSDDSGSEDTDSNEEGDVAATEEFTELHRVAIEHHLVLEQRFYEDSANSLGYSNESIDGFIDGAVNTAVYGTGAAIAGAAGLVKSAAVGAAKGIGQGAVFLGSLAYRNLIKSEDGQDMLLTKLAKLGIEYGKSGLLQFSKGIFYALSQTAVGLVAGSKLLVRTIKKRSTSYESFQSRISKARDILKVINETALGDQDGHDAVYNDLINISMLKVGDDLDFHQHLKTLNNLMTTYGNKLPRYVAGCAASSKALINEVMSGRTDITETKFIDTFPLPNMRSVKHIDGIETMQYTYTLPGDRIFRVDIPDAHTDDYNAAKAAYHESRAYIAQDSNSAQKQAAECRYLKPDEIEAHLNILEQLCQQGMSLDKQFKEVDLYRKQLKPSISSYIDYLVSKERDITIRESLAEFISLKVAFMDHVVIGGHLKLHDLNITVISAGLSYVKASLQRYK